MKPVIHRATVVKARYLGICDSCGDKCTYLIRAGRRYLHVCTRCLKETLDAGKEQVER